MANTNRPIDKYIEYDLLDGGWLSWATPASGTSKNVASGWYSGNFRMTECLAFRLPGVDYGALTAFSFSCSFLNRYDNAQSTLYCYLFSEDPTSYYDAENSKDHAVAYQQYTAAAGFNGSHTFSFSNLALRASDTLYVMLAGSGNSVGTESWLYVSTVASASATITQQLYATPTSPKNITRTATQPMTYTWSLSGTTTQEEALVQYRTDSTWFTLGTVSGSSTTLSSNVRPPAGTVYWRVMVKNTLGNWGPWSDEASFTLQYVSTSYLIAANSPTSGYIRRTTQNSFYVVMRANGTPERNWYIKQDTAVFYWRNGTSGSWTDVPMTIYGAESNGATVSIPANTFPKTNSLQWYATAQDQNGNTRSTSVYTLSSWAAPITATPVSPIDTIESSSSPTVFTWRNSSAIPSDQAAAQLQYSTNGGTSWTELGSVAGTSTSYSVPENTIPGGQIAWRVRAQDTDDVWGNWSSPVLFVNFGAPVVSNVIADGKPYATITWESSTQQAYRITVDGKIYGPYFGEAVRSFTLLEPLEDGAHTVSVEAQNAQGQWSHPEHTSFTVENIPGADIVLTVSSGIDARLSWSAGEGNNLYVLYRDDVKIVQTSEQTFDDRVVLGAHSWYVIEKIPDGYYTKSNTVTGACRVCKTQIAPLSGGNWIELKLTESRETIQSFTWARTIALRHVTGTVYPVIEISPYDDISGSYDVSFRDVASARKFENLRGQMVIIKSREGNVIIGCLSSMRKSVKDFYVAYSFTVQRVHLEEFSDVSDS